MCPSTRHGEIKYACLICPRRPHYIVYGTLESKNLSQSRSRLKIILTCERPGGNSVVRRSSRADATRHDSIERNESRTFGTVDYRNGPNSSGWTRHKIVLESSPIECIRFAIVSHTQNSLAGRRHTRTTSNRILPIFYHDVWNLQ